MSVTLNAVSIGSDLKTTNLFAKIGTGSIKIDGYDIVITEIDGGYRLTATRGTDVQTMDVKDGVGIAGIEKTASVGLTDVYTITLTDGSSYTFTVTNGSGGGGSADVPIASDAVAGIIRVGENLKIDENGVLSVDTATAVEEDNTRPVTSAAVQTTVGNIEILLKTI